MPRDVKRLAATKKRVLRALAHRVDVNFAQEACIMGCIRLHDRFDILLSVDLPQLFPVLLRSCSV